MDEVCNVQELTSVHFWLIEKLPMSKNWGHSVLPWHNLNARNSKMITAKGCYQTTLCVKSVGGSVWRYCKSKQKSFTVLIIWDHELEIKKRVFTFS